MKLHYGTKITTSHRVPPEAVPFFIHGLEREVRRTKPCKPEITLGSLLRDPFGYNHFPDSRGPYHYPLGGCNIPQRLMMKRKVNETQETGVLIWPHQATPPDHNLPEAILRLPGRLCAIV